MNAYRNGILKLVEGTKKKKLRYLGTYAPREVPNLRAWIINFYDNTNFRPSTEELMKQQQ